MIMDHLNQAHLYKTLSPWLDRALAALTSSLPDKPPGRYDIAGDNVYAMVQTYDTRSRSDGKWEAHRRFIDIQYIASGVEVVGVAPLARLEETQPYDPARDVAFYEGTGQFLTLHPGEFMILYPHDAHMPQISSGLPAAVKKVVLKVSV